MRTQNSRVLTVIALAGVLCIFGGEMFCILGPMRFEREVHLACHAILYSGIALVSSSAAVYWRRRSH
jgi:hypothetical protein